MDQHAVARAVDERHEDLLGRRGVHGKIEARLDRLPGDVRHLHAQRRQQRLVDAARPGLRFARVPFLEPCHDLRLDLGRRGRRRQAAGGKQDGAKSE